MSGSQIHVPLPARNFQEVLTLLPSQKAWRERYTERVVVAVAYSISFAYIHYILIFDIFLSIRYDHSLAVIISLFELEAK